MLQGHSEDFTFDFKDKNGKIIATLDSKITIKDPIATQPKSQPISEYDAFISYSWGCKPDFFNKPKVRKVYDELSKANLSCWLDQVQ